MTSLALSLLFVCAPALGQETAAPSLQPDVLAAFEAAAANAEENGALSLVVRKGGDVVFEHYAEGTSPDDIMPLASATKAFWGVVAAAAVDDGLLSLDELVADTLEPWRNVHIKEAVTVRDLLQLESGIDANHRPLRKDWTKDLFEAAVNADMQDELHTVFRDGPAPFFVFGALLAAKLGDEDIEAYVRRRVLDPIGLEIPVWTRDQAGNPHMPYGAYVSARGWSRFGQLLVEGGAVGEQRVVSEDSLAAVSQASAQNPCYRMGVWTRDALDRVGRTAAEFAAADDPEVQARVLAHRASLAGLPEDLVFIAGRGLQRMYVVPSQELVVVRLGVPPAGRFSEIEWLRLLFGVEAPPAATPLDVADESDEG